jgi:uncharacterized cupin superfamily protein
VIDEARMERVDAGHVPVGEGWFVANVRELPWITHDAFGAVCTFEGYGPVVRERPDLDPLEFEQIGYTLAVLAPGQPSGLYHGESNQEDFLVLAGECLLLIEGEERRLRAWDFVHCPPGAEHIFVGAGHGPCVIFMIGARTREKHIVYPESELARRHGAGVESETSSPDEAYSRFPHWQAGRPDVWDEPPWAT